MVRCPVDGCDYGSATTSTAALRSHVNATPEHPDWSDVEERLQQAGSAGATSDGSTSEDGSDRTSENRPGEQTEPSESRSSDMATDDEYERQHDQATDQRESPDGDGDDDQRDGGDGPAGFPALQGRTLLLLAVALLVIVALISLLRRRRGEETDTSPGVDNHDDGDTSEDSTPDIESGLIQEERHA